MFDKHSWEPINPGDSTRLRRTAWLFLFLIGIVLGQSFWISILKRDQYLKKCPSYRKQVTLFARRGQLYDRNMNILAMDIPTYTLAADLKATGDINPVCGAFARILGGEFQKYRDLIRRKTGKSLCTIQRNISENQRNALIDAGIKGLVINPTRQRMRPCGMLGIQVLGWTNAAHCGVSGIEQQMESVLRGEDGFAVLQVDGRQRSHSSPDEPTKPPKNGSHVVLTLDQTYQTILEEELRKGVSLFKAEGGSAVLMDPFSGEILGMASINSKPFEDPSVDLIDGIQNRAVQSAFEPGSTLKVVTAAAALEEDVFKPETPIECENGSYRFAGQVIHDHREHYGLLTFSQVVEYSSNIGIVKITKKLGKKSLYRYLQNFGFGTKTAVDLPGENAGFLPPVYDWNSFTTATIGFGQGISVSTVQMACMMSVIANGGELVRPQIIRTFLDGDEEETVEPKAQVIRRVISTETASIIGEILENAVRRGSAMKARVQGLRIAGKTGTAQKSFPGVRGYVPGAYTSSFAGFWPREAPQYVLVVVLEEPKESYWASQSAAPIFAKIVGRMVGIPTTPWIPKEDQDHEEAKTAFIFSSASVPARASSLTRDSKDSVNDSPYHMPRLVGMSLRMAMQELAKRRMEARVEGEGIVVKQSPDAGQRLEPGMVCTLLCSDERTNMAEE